MGRIRNGDLHGFAIAQSSIRVAALRQQNDTPRGFQPSYRFGIEAGPNIRLPHPDCLMVKELKRGSLDAMHGLVDYSFYEALHEG